jgi:hypothetical protein
MRSNENAIRQKQRAVLLNLGTLRCAWCFLLLVFFAALASPFQLRAENPLQREYEIKAAYLYNFINYIEWPENALSVKIRSAQRSKFSTENRSRAGPWL